MNIAVYLTPINEHHMKLAAQAGATDVVAPYPGPDPEVLIALRDTIAAYGLRLAVIERLLPHLKIVHGLDGYEDQLDTIKNLVRNMGAAGIPVLCYNWMPSDDWMRSSIDEKERGGALVTAFDIKADPPRVPTDTGYEHQLGAGHITDSDALWANLESFLKEIIPVAEEAGISLALHPDDPPVDELRGQPHIINNVEAFERVMGLFESESNGICFCQGTMATRGVDIPDAISRLSKHIKFVHFRDVVGTPENFRECFIDTGKTDMAAAMRAYMGAGLEDVPIRPDHAPTMDGETNENPGYEMLGRLHALGYMKGVMDSC